MNLVASMKACQRCKEEKPVEAFALASRSRDGRQKWCRMCSAAYQRENRGKANERSRRFRQRNPEAGARYLREAREQAISHYSMTQPPSCACCGEAEPVFLVLDHINGGGNEERRQVGRGLHIRLRALGWPVGYQVLCWNCNAAKAYHGVCPHEQTRLEAVV